MSVKRSFGLHRYTDVTVGLTGIVQKCRLQKLSELIKDIKSHNRTWKENSRVQPSLSNSFHILAYCYQPFCVQSLASSVSILRHLNCAQWHRHSRSCQGKCPGRYTSALAAALAVKSFISKINQDILTVLADATNDLSMSRHQQRTGAATDCTSFGTVSGGSVAVTRAELLGYFSLNHLFSRPASRIGQCGMWYMYVYIVVKRFGSRG